MRLLEPPNGKQRRLPVVRMKRTSVVPAEREIFEVHAKPGGPDLGPILGWGGAYRATLIDARSSSPKLVAWQTRLFPSHYGRSLIMYEIVNVSPSSEELVSVCGPTPKLLTAA
jgi:hypothetical protein